MRKRRRKTDMQTGRSAVGDRKKKGRATQLQHHPYTHTSGGPAREKGALAFG